MPDLRAKKLIYFLSRLSGGWRVLMETVIFRDAYPEQDILLNFRQPVKKRPGEVAIDKYS